MQSILLIIIVVMIGVRLKNAIIISVALPLSILSTFIVMQILKIEFHFISIAALIVSLGILVDNAIVMSEAIQLNLNRGIEKTQSIKLAIKSTAMPVFSSTLTTVVTFSIIYFVPGTVGQIAGTIPTVVIASLIASYFVAMLVIPVLAYIFFEPEKEDKIAKVSKIKLFIDKLLVFSLKHKLSVIVMAFITLGISLLLATSLGMQFFPAANKPVIYINFEGEGMSVQSSEYVASQINEVLDNEEVIENYTYAVGKGLPTFFLTVPTMTTAPNVGQYMLELNETIIEDNYGTNEEFARQLQDKLNQNVTSAIATVKTLEFSIPSEATISYAVSGDADKIYEIANQMVLELENIDGTDNVRTTMVQSQYDYQINLDSEVLSSYGLLKYDVLKQVNTALMGAEAGIFQGADEDMDIILKSDINTLTDLNDLYIVGSVANTKVSLNQIAEISLKPSIPVIEHYNGENFVYVLSDVMPGYSSLTIENQLTEDFIEIAELEGVKIKGLGEVKNMMDLISNLGISSVIAVIVIYLILAMQFKNYNLPFIVLSSIPLSLIGCGFGLWIFNMDIQVMAMLGLVSLFGIVVNNGILLVEVMIEKTKAGESVEEACKQAVSERYRPIFMSSITTCIGLVPLILSGDPMSAPMASVLLFGLLFSTILTMVVVPTLYAYQQTAKIKNKDN